MTFYRKLLPTDLNAYRAHLLRLSSQDRYARFCGFKTDEAIGSYCRGIDWRFTIMVGCFVRGELRAVAELRTEPKVWPGEGELAVSVEKEFQGQGFGSGVVRRIMTVARNRSLRRLMLICMINNRRMQAIVRKFLGKLECDSGEATGWIEMPWPNQLSLMQEALDNSAALVNGVLDQWQGKPEEGAVVPPPPDGLLPWREPVTLIRTNAAVRAAEQGDRERHGIRRDHPGPQSLRAE